MISGILNKVGWKLIKSSFFVRIKLLRFWHIFGPHFYKTVNDFKIIRQIFLLLQQIVLYLLYILYLFYINLKSIVTIQLAAQNAGQMKPLKCYAKKFVIVDRQTEEDWVLPHYLLSERVFLPKSLLQKKKKELNSQKPMVNTVSTTRRTTLCWMRGEIEELLFIEITICPFRKKKISKKQE